MTGEIVDGRTRRALALREARRQELLETALEVFSRSGARLGDLHTRLLHEHRGNDEEDEQQEHDVNQRRDVDPAAVFSHGAVTKASHAGTLIGGHTPGAPAGSPPGPAVTMCAP